MIVYIVLGIVLCSLELVWFGLILRDVYLRYKEKSLVIKNDSWLISEGEQIMNDELVFKNVFKEFYGVIIDGEIKIVDKIALDLFYDINYLDDFCEPAEGKNYDDYEDDRNKAFKLLNNNKDHIERFHRLASHKLFTNYFYSNVKVNLFFNYCKQLLEDVVNFEEVLRGRGNERDNEYETRIYLHLHVDYVLDSTMRDLFFTALINDVDNLELVNSKKLRYYPKDNGISNYVYCYLKVHKDNAEEIAELINSTNGLFNYYATIRHGE